MHGRVRWDWHASVSVQPLSLEVADRRVAGAGGAQAAKDAAGNDVKQSVWLQSHKPSETSVTCRCLIALLSSFCRTLQGGFTLLPSIPSCNCLQQRLMLTPVYLCCLPYRSPSLDWASL